jgi:hypothetical protein
MITNNVTKRTKTMLFTNNQVFDAYRNYERIVKLFGITIYHGRFNHHMEYNQAMLETKTIGFVKTNQNEETK